MPYRSVDAAPVLGPVYKRPGSPSYRTTTGLARSGHQRNSGVPVASQGRRNYYSGQQTIPVPSAHFRSLLQFLKGPTARPYPLMHREGEWQRS